MVQARSPEDLPTREARDVAERVLRADSDRTGPTPERILAAQDDLDALKAADAPRAQPFGGVTEVVFPGLVGAWLFIGLAAFVYGGTAFAALSLVVATALGSAWWRWDRVRERRRKAIRIAERELIAARLDHRDPSTDTGPAASDDAGPRPTDIGNRGDSGAPL